MLSSKNKILIVAPHPDDAEIAAFALYSKYHNSSYIVTVIAGDAGVNKYDELSGNVSEQYLRKARVRVWNSLTVPQLAGVPPENILNLGYFDGTLSDMYNKSPGSVYSLHTGVKDLSKFRRVSHSAFHLDNAEEATWEGLVGDFKKIIEQLNPDVIVSPYPIIDAHGDHKFTTIALFEAITSLGYRNGKLLLYTNHYTLSKYYPYGPQGSIVTLPPFFSGNLYFDSVFSFNVTEGEQSNKVLALDAMNDLRLDTEWMTLKGALYLLLKNLKRIIVGSDYSYYRRAVRSNELFFVVDIEAIYDPDVASAISGL